MIDDAIAQYPVEPPQHRLSDLVAALEAANESLLDDLLGEGVVADAPLDVLQERAVVANQLVDDLLRGRAPV